MRPEGDAAVARAMLPVKPPRLLSVIVAVPVWPGKIVRLGDPETEKSTTLTATRTEWVREPLVAVTVKV